jgi:sucrose-6-phosphate hydrolase SacC (GH32 family)
MVAFWSRFDNHSQCISYSLDHGRTWKLYEKNPIFDHPERDPKVFWYAPGKHWVMMLYGDKQYHVLTSANLLDWKDEHKAVPNSYECPDLFELPVDGDAKAKKWVLIQGSGNYSIGSFDGTHFKEETDRFACDIGPNFYATQTWANTETGDGRRIQSAWMRGGVYPNMPFNQQVSFPCELTLHATPSGLRLFRAPIHEITLLHKTPDTWTNRSLNRGAALPLDPSGDSFHIQAEVSIPDGAKLTFNLCGATLVLSSKSIESGAAHAPIPSQLKTVEILVDRTSIETFVNHGEVSSSRCFLPEQSGLSVKADGGQVAIHSLIVYPLNSAWEK